MKPIGVDKKIIECERALERRQPVLLYGPTGNGKTIVAWEVAKNYSEKYNVPIIYLQLYPEMTKNSLIGGDTIKNGSIVIEEREILQFGKKGKGAIFIVDECTHTMEPVLLAFNSLIEEPYTTVVGGKIYELDDKTRFIFCGNTPDHIGNIDLPISFANRLYIVNMPLVDKMTLISIGENLKTNLPTKLIEFYADIIIKTHEPSFPISPRNLIICLKATKSLVDTCKKTNDCHNKEICKFCKKYNINSDELKETIMSSMMVHIPLKSLGGDKVRALLW